MAVKNPVLNWGAFVLFFGCSWCCADPGTLKIGFIGPLTGDAAFYGTSSKNGIELALKDLGPQAQIKVIYEDDQFQVSNTVAAFKRLTEIEQVDVIISIASSPSKAVAPLAEARGVPLLAWASDPLVSEGRRFVVRTYPSGADEGAAAAREALRLGYRKNAAFFAINDYPASVRKGFLATMPPANLAAEFEVAPSEHDLKPLLLKARAVGADAAFLCLNPGQNGLAAKQARQLGMQVKFYGCENLSNTEELKAADGALADAWLISVGSAPEFEKRYVEQFKQPFISGAAIHYDTTHLLNRLASKSVRGEKLIAELLSAGPISGALPRAEFIARDGDQLMEIPLLPKRAG